jgi:hypothetical protein
LRPAPIRLIDNFLERGYADSLVNVLTIIALSCSYRHKKKYSEVHDKLLDEIIEWIATRLRNVGQSVDMADINAYTRILTRYTSFMNLLMRPWENEKEMAREYSAVRGIGADVRDAVHIKHIFNQHLTKVVIDEFCESFGCVWAVRFIAAHSIVIDKTKGKYVFHPTSATYIVRSTNEILDLMWLGERCFIDVRKILATADIDKIITIFLKMSDTNHNMRCGCIGMIYDGLTFYKALLASSSLLNEIKLYTCGSGTVKDVFGKYLEPCVFCIHYVLGDRVKKYCDELLAHDDNQVPQPDAH